VDEDASVNLHRKVVSQTYRVLFGVSLLLAVVIITIGVSLRHHHDSASLVLLAVGTGIFSTLVFNILDAVLSRGEFSRLLEEQSALMMGHLAALHEQQDAVANARDIGLVKIFPWDQDVECRAAMARLIKEARQLTVVMNYARSWTNRHHDVLAERMADPARRTLFLLPRPDEIGARAQAEKQSATLSTFSEDQRETFETLCRYTRTESGSPPFEMIGHRFFNTYFLLLSDTEALLSPMFISGGKKDLSCFWYRKTATGDDYYSKLAADVSALKEPEGSIDLCRHFLAERAAPQIDTSGERSLGVRQPLH